MLRSSRSHFHTTELSWPLATLTATCGCTDSGPLQPITCAAAFRATSLSKSGFSTWVEEFLTSGPAQRCRRASELREHQGETSASFDLSALTDHQTFTHFANIRRGRATDPDRNR